MKKIMALVLALCMVFALAACGQSAAPAATEAPAADAAADAAPAAEEKVVIKFGYTPGDLKPEDVEWSVEHAYIAKVENGYVTALQSGTTEITAKYGDQTVKCIVRCHN